MTFRDDKGREWSVRMDLDALSRIEQTSAVNVFAEAQKAGGLGALMFGSIDRVRRALYCCVARDAVAQGVSVAEFFAGVNSARAYRDGAEALAVAVAEFFPETRPEPVEEDRRPRPTDGSKCNGLRRLLAWIIPARILCGSCAGAPRR